MWHRAEEELLVALRKDDERRAELRERHQRALRAEAATEVAQRRQRGWLWLGAVSSVDSWIETQFRQGPKAPDSRHSD
jgi:hypothetical protein